MHKRVKATICLVISIALGLFLILTDVKDQKITFAQTKPETSDSATVILVDNSGSMGRCSKIDSQEKCVPDAEQPYRIESVKDIIRQRISQGSFSSSKIGLAEFGNWKSYGLSYENRCQAFKPLVLPSTDSRNKVSEALKEINTNDDGVTPIGFAINAVVEDIFRKYDLFPAKIVLISDGDPNCVKEYKINLCDIVAGLVGRGVDLKIKIFGYKAKGKDNEFRSCANKFPGMVEYFPSETPAELDRNLERDSPPPVPTSSGWKCLFRRVGIVLLFIICALCIALLIAIIASLVFPNSFAWTVMGTLKLLLPSDPTSLALLIAAIGALATLISIWASGLTTISCN